MKCAVLFFFVACAFVAQSNARSVDLADRGAIADAMRAKLLASKQTMNKLVDNTSDKVKDAIKKIQHKVDVLIDQLHTKAQQYNDKAFVKAEQFIDKVEQFEDKYSSYLNIVSGDEKTEVIDGKLPSSEPLEIEDVIPFLEDAVPSTEDVVPAVEVAVPAVEHVVPTAATTAAQ